MSVASVRGLLSHAVHRFPKASVINGLPIPLAKSGITGSVGNPYWVPEKNGPGFKHSVRQLWMDRGFATQSKPPQSEDARRNSSRFAREALDLLKKQRDKISFVEIHPPVMPLSEQEIGRILEAMAQTRSHWHSVVLVPPTELLEDGPCTKDPEAAHLEEAMEKIKMSLSYPSIAFLNVGIRSGALIRLLHYSLQEGYSIQFQLNAPPERG